MIYFSQFTCLASEIESSCITQPGLAVDCSLITSRLSLFIEITVGVYCIHPELESLLVRVILILNKEIKLLYLVVIIDVNFLII